MIKFWSGLCEKTSRASTQELESPVVHFEQQNYSSTDAVLTRGLAIFSVRKISWHPREKMLSQVGRLKYNSF